MGCFASLRYVDGTSGTSSPYYDSPTAGRYLKSASGWYDNGNGLDAYGFAALPGGLGYSGGGGYSGGVFDDVGKLGSWWSASERSSNYAYPRNMVAVSESVSSEVSYLKTDWLSVRCVQD